MEYIKNLYEQNDRYQTIQKTEILTNLDNLNISAVALREEEIMKRKDTISKEVYTTYKHPFLIEKRKNILYINPDYYVKNQEEIDYLLSEIIKSTTKTEFEIANTPLITSNIIESLAQNGTINEVSLAMYDENKYILTKEDYDILKKSTLKKVKTSAVSDELREVFDPLIAYNYNRRLIGYNTYKELSNEVIHLSNKITKEELENLKYLQNSITKIVIKEANIEDAILICEKLESYQKENHVIIDVNNKELVSAKIIANKNYLNHHIDIRLIKYTDIIPIKEYMRLENLLYQMVEPAKNLSPFERYIVAYNAVKQYKQYKENEQDKFQSRNLYAILENEYMVCAGYSYMLEDLLNKSKINSIKRHIDVDISYDQEDENEVISSQKGGHVRRFIYINDQKYGIDGFYITDPTWDNDLEKDLYNHLVLTGEEEENTKRYNFFSKSIFDSSIELMNIRSLEEFYQKINFYLDKNPNANLKGILSNLIIDLKNLAPNFIQNLKDKYPGIEANNMEYPNEKEILYDIGQYLLTKVNKPITGEVIMEAVSEVYQKIYHLEGQELQNKLSKTLEENKTYQHLSFPKRYKIDEYGNRIELPSISDKFDIDTNSYHK